MSSDKLVSIEAVKRALENAYYGEATLGELFEALDGISPVEQPMSAVEYEKALDRMEDSVGGFEVKRLWNAVVSSGFIEKAVAIVKKWVEEHPEERSENDAEI